MLIVGMAVVVRPGPVAITTSIVPPLVARAPAVHGATPQPLPAAERFRSLLRQADEAARAGALGESIGLFRAALELRPLDAEAWNSLGVVLVRQGDPAEGIQAFRRSLRADPNLADAHRNLAVALDRHGNPREAAIRCRAFLRLAPRDHGARDEVTRRLSEIDSKALE